MSDPPHRAHELPPEGVDFRFPVDTGCFGCSPSNPHGLGLLFQRRGEAIVGTCRLPAHLQGQPGVAHGGIVSLLLDEYSCAASYFLRGVLVVTGSLDVRFERPCPVDADVSLEARVADASHPRYCVIEAVALYEGAPVARSRGRFFPAVR